MPKINIIPKSTITNSLSLPLSKGKNFKQNSQISTARNLIPLDKDVIHIKDKRIKDLKWYMASVPLNATKQELLDRKDAFLSICRQISKENNNLNSYKEMVEFAGRLYDKGNETQKKLAKVIYSTVIKVFTEAEEYEALIKLVEKDLRCQQEANDKIHIVGRLHVLKDAYKALGNKEKFYQALLDARKCIDEVLENYDDYVKNYQTLTRSAPSQDKLLKGKARVCSQLAVATAHKKRETSVKFLKEAISIYEKLNMKKEVIFAENQLKRLRKSRMPNKLKEYNGLEMSAYLHEKVYRSTKSGTPQKPVKAQYTNYWRYKNPPDGNQ